MRLLKYIFLELKNNFGFSSLFILNLSFGLLGFISLEAFKESVDQTIELRSKGILGADFGISARRPFSDQELKVTTSVLPKNTETSQMVEFFSMVAGPGGESRLVQVKAIEANYPFYGEILLRKNGVVNSETQLRLVTEQRVWIYPELMRQLNVKVGDTLVVGQGRFIVDDIVDEDAAAGFSTSMAPRIYMNRSHLPSTELITKGTIAWHSVVHKIPQADIEQLNGFRDRIFDGLDNPEVRVYTHKNVSSQVATLLNRLNDFLGLCSLVALFLAGAGSAFLYRSYFNGKVKELATFMSLGASRATTFSYSLLQVALLGLVSALVALVLSLLLVPGLGNLTQGLLPFAVDFHIPVPTLFYGLVIGALGSVVLCLPVLAGLEDLQPALLFFANHRAPQRLSLIVILSTLPCLLLFWFLSVQLSHSYLVGGLFSLTFLASGFILGGSGWIFSSMIRFWNPQSLSLKWAVKDLVQNKSTHIVCFVTLGLSALLLNLIPQLATTLSVELESPEESKVPSFFMFDIQEEQVPVLQQVLSKEGVEIDTLSPMIRARLMQVNGRDFDKGVGAASDQMSREEEREMRFRNRGFNLSYRAQLSPSETIVAGRPFKGSFVEEEGHLPEISLEKRFAERLDLKIDDVLTFDIESIPIQGRVVNLRSVKWTSFQPNFFVQFQPGVLEIAPKTFIATVPKIALEKKQKLQDQIVQSLPNISMVNVARIVKRISAVVEQMLWALLFMSVLGVLAGFVVIYSIANHQARQRKWDIGLLKALGADFKTIRAQFLWQFGLVSGVAISLGATISLLISGILSHYVFDRWGDFNFWTPLVTLVFGVMLTLIVTKRATSRALEVQVKELLS